ncbi:GntR family transcriptional regulator [Rubrivivax gelatinosus]|uniref:GntR family transcriptional regulator n=1 Tax=Rubrivivax gelatinosus TaxID=28068 RepID=A0ABS1E019_RUBGE|nr:GntR family transcriptional regulator [Rubrivivax gelatinosus]MBK1614522.1 GntR family transcriptional regulator [Rubrivivax gelatinosus]MBK1715163.1 GntR family transcriptional regulator [Rubrivivax gelatinosus]
MLPYPLSLDSSRLAAAHDEAYAHILKALRHGRYRAGERLVPETIAAEIGTSRMPVREALRRLAAEGLVTVRANRGVTVNALNVRDMQEAFEMRAVLEGLAARLAVPRLAAADIRRLERMVDAMEDREAPGADWTTAHRAFHEALCAYAESPRLQRQIESLHALVEPHMRLWDDMADRHVGTREHHDRLLEVLRSGEPAAAEAAMRSHVMDTVPDLLRRLAAGP